MATAMRPTWKGSVSFGLVHIPVQLYLAAKSERLSFRLLHESDLGRIRYSRICEVDGEEVPWSETIKGYEYAKGQYVPVSNEDLESIDIGVQKAIEIVQFVQQDEIDPIFYDKPYFLEPSRGAERAYVLLREALRQSGKVGIARVVFREREYLAAVRVRGDALALDTLRFAAELRDASSLSIPSATEVPPKQLELAQLLIEELSSAWRPEEHDDRYDAAVLRMIERKQAGLPPPSTLPAAPRAEVIDLAEVLRRSLAKASKEKPGEGARRAPAAAAARETRDKPPRKKAPTRKKRS